MLCIKNGRIHDLVKEEPYVADILVKDGKIAAIWDWMVMESVLRDRIIMREVIPVLRSFAALTALIPWIRQSIWQLWAV